MPAELWLVLDVDDLAGILAIRGNLIRNHVGCEIAIRTKTTSSSTTRMVSELLASHISKPLVRSFALSMARIRPSVVRALQECSAIATWSIPCVTQNWRWPAKGFWRD